MPRDIDADAEYRSLLHAKEIQPYAVDFDALILDLDTQADQGVRL